MHVPILLNSKHRSAEMFIETLIGVPKFDYTVLKMKSVYSLTFHNIDSGLGLTKNSKYQIQFLNIKFTV